MDTEKEIEQLKTEVYNLKMQLSAIAGHIVAQNYCQCTCSLTLGNNICQNCNKPLMQSGVAQTGT